MSPDDKVAMGCLVFVALMIVVSVIKGKKSNRRLYSKYTQPETRGIRRMK